MDDIQYTTDEQIDELRHELQLAKINRRVLGNIKEAKVTAPKTGCSRFLSVLSRVSFILIVVFLSTILISVLVAKNSGQTPNVFGYQIYTVKTGSMIPTFPIGTAILVKRPSDPTKLEEGTIVTFVDGNVTITHRIIEIVKVDDKVSYRTKGDNKNNSPDLNLLTPDRVKGVFIVKIPLT
jgi:signal peptidase